jgi:hypothetical protein
VETQNVTLAIPKEVLSDAELLAMKRQTSLSKLLTQMLAEMVAQENGYTKAKDHHLSLLDENLDLGTRGVIDWRREDVHAR